MDNADFSFTHHKRIDPHRRRVARPGPWHGGGVRAPRMERPRHGTARRDAAARSGGASSGHGRDRNAPDQIAALRERLSGRRFDILFVNAGIANSDHDAAVGAAAEDGFVRVMLTNVLGVMRTVEGLQDLTPPGGMIGIMSSGQGSIGDNIKGGREVYRASKAALNQSMRSYAARHAGEARAMILMAPGWIRTDLGGADAPFGMEEAIPQIVDVLIGQQGVAGLRYLDRNGQTVPW
jgi:NAD(P)-dependent dehydrogenase (short-subunit alcohol dehydrogenase family)